MPEVITVDSKQLKELIEAIKANSAAMLARLDGLEKKVELTAAEKENAAKEQRTVQLANEELKDSEIPEDWRKYIGNYKMPLGPAKFDREKLARAVKSMKFFLALMVNDHATMKAMGEATDTAGGYLVPEEFRAEVILKLQVLPIMRNIARVWPMGRDRVLIPSEAARIAVAWEAENVQWSETDAQFGQVALQVHRLNGFSRMSRELLADSAVAVMDVLAQMYSEAIGLEEDKQFMIGNGVDKPLGLNATTGIGSVAQAGGALAYDDFVELFYTLGRQYRRNAVWMMADANVKKSAKLKDSNGRPIFDSAVNAPSGAPGGGTPGAMPQTGTILGRPVMNQDDIQTNVIYFGDPRYYFIGDRGEMGAEMTTVGAGTFEKHQAAIKVWERVDGRVALPDAFKKLTGVS